MSDCHTLDDLTQQAASFMVLRATQKKQTPHQTLTHTIHIPHTVTYTLTHRYTSHTHIYTHTHTTYSHSPYSHTHITHAPQNTNHPKTQIKKKYTHI